MLQIYCFKKTSFVFFDRTKYTRFFPQCTLNLKFPRFLWPQEDVDEKVAVFPDRPEHGLNCLFITGVIRKASRTVAGGEDHSRPISLRPPVDVCGGVERYLWKHMAVGRCVSSASAPLFVQGVTVG